MLEVILGSILGLNIMILAAFWVKLQDLIQLVESEARRYDDIEVKVPDIDDLKEDLLGIFHNMSPPSFMDHIGGAVGAILQAKAMKTMHEMAPDVGLINNDSTISESHG